MIRSPQYRTVFSLLLLVFAVPASAQSLEPQTVDGDLVVNGTLTINGDLIVRGRIITGEGTEQPIER